jgi:hypothetical protein
MGGSLAAGASATVTVTPAPIPQNSAVTPDLYADTLTFTTSAPGDVQHTVALHQTAQGAILTFNPNTLKMNGVPVDQSAQSTFEVVNQGNLTATAMVNLMGAQDFQLDLMGVNVAGAGGASTVTVTFSPRMAGQQNASVSLSTSTTLCGPLPSPLTVSGKTNNGNGNGQ